MYCTTDLHRYVPTTPQTSLCVLSVVGFLSVSQMTHTALTDTHILFFNKVQYITSTFGTGTYNGRGERFKRQHCVG